MTLMKVHWGWLLAAILLGGALGLKPQITAQAIGLAVAISLIAIAIRWLTPGVDHWIRLSVAILLGQLLLSYGFSNVLLRVGNIPVPPTELVLLVCLVASLRHLSIEKSTPSHPLLAIVLLWVVFNLTFHMPSGWANAGIFAARDALPTVEMLWVIPFFLAVALMLKSNDGRTGLRRIFVTVAVAASTYNLTFPFQEEIITASPKVAGFSNDVALFGWYGSQNVGYILLFAALLWWWQANKSFILREVVFVALCVVSSLVTYVLAQARVSYIYLVLGFVVLTLTGRHFRTLSVVAAVVASFVVALVVIEITGIEIKGRISSLSATGVYDHLLSLTGDSNNAEFSGSANGVAQRKQWWSDSLHKWSETPLTVVFGIGFGQALTDHITIGSGGEEIIVREPHNSFISTLTRSGLMGLLIVMALHLTVCAAAITGYIRFQENNRTVAAAFLGGLLCELYFLLSAWGQPFFENPYCAIPMYFVHGFVLATTVHYRGLGASNIKNPNRTAYVT